MPRASFALSSSAPLEELDGGIVRVVDPSASIDVQLQVSGPPVPWPVLGAYQSWAGGMVWDAARARITRFGGGDEWVLEDTTSIWDPIAGWQVLPIASPPPRTRTSLVYDSLRQRVVLFGGLGANGLLADTWEFDGSQWTEVTPATSPPRRMAHAAAFDEDTGRMILFGGLAGPDATKLELGDTWSWDGFSWTQLQPAVSPSARDSLAMTWDGTRRRVTLAAGWDGTNILSDAWAWVGGTWQSLAPLPAPRTSAALVWSPVSHELLLVGGWDPRVPVYEGSVFRFDGSVWRTAPQIPRAAARMSLVGHPTLGAIMHGGRTATGFSSETALLEPTWQRLPQGDRAERTLTNGFTVVGERYVWRPSLNGNGEAGPLVPVFHIPVGMRVMGMASYTNLYGVLDGGMVGWNVNFVGGARINAPPPFEAIGGQVDNDWVLDLDGGFHEVRSDSAWHFVSTAPVALRALHARVQSRVEFLAWSDRLNIWTPHDAGLSGDRRRRVFAADGVDGDRD